MRVPSRSVVLALAALAAAVPAHAQMSVNRTVDFELDRWFELEERDGPVTLHRLRLERDSGGLKSRLAGSNEFQVPIRVILEYSNHSSKDWEANFHVVWSDASGEPIDGYTGSSDIDEEKKFERAGGTVSTLKYGLTRARKLKIVINAKPD